MLRRVVAPAGLIQALVFDLLGARLGLDLDEDPLLPI